MFCEISIPVLLSVILVPICLTGCGYSIGAEETEEFRQTYKVEAGTKIEVHNMNGTIIITKWEGDSVEVHGLKKTRRGKSELEKVRIRVSTNGALVIETVYIEGDANVSVDYEVRVPGDVVVGHITNSNGRIEVEGTKGDATATTSNGRIEMRDVDGYVSAMTSNGRINILGTTGVLKAGTSNGSMRVEIFDVKGDCNVTTSNGSVELYVSPNLNADVEMRTTNGKVSIHDVQVVTSESSSERMTGRIGSGGNRITCTTSNGDVDLHQL